MADPERTALTFRMERWRAIAHGILETAGTTFLLLIVVVDFESGPISKALVAGGGSAGLLLTPVMVAIAERIGVPTSRLAAGVAVLGAMSFVAMILLPWLPVFVVGSVVTMAASSAVIPLLTQMYQDNYPEARRGRLFSKTVMIRIGTAAMFSELAGRVLTRDMDYWPWLLGVFALAYACSAYCLARCPSRPLQTARGGHPFRSLRFARHDRLFRHTLICWMLMGFGNLMMLPLRVEFLANPKYGLTMSSGEIAFLVGVVPNAARLVVSPIWGWLFDRMNFFVLRATLNLGFALGIVAFFTSDSVTGLLVGAIIYGISNAGGDVAWGLWVTKFAPPNRVAEYMSVHTFFTGVRGVLAPIIAFQMARHFSLATLGALSSALILVSAAMLLTERRAGRRARPAAALVEEVSE